MSSMIFIFVLSPLEGQRQIRKEGFLLPNFPSFLISPTQLLTLGKFFSCHLEHIGLFSHPSSIFWPEKTMGPGTHSLENKIFKKLERRDFSSLIPSFLILGRRNPSFLISLSRLLRLGIFVSGHQATTYGITSLDWCSDPKKVWAPQEEPGQIIFSKN